MVGHLRNLQPLSLTLLLNLHEVGQRAHLILHLTQSDQFVEFLIGIGFQRFVHDHGVLLLYLFRILCRTIGDFCILIVIEDSSDDTEDKQQRKGADGEASAPL